MTAGWRAGHDVRVRIPAGFVCLVCVVLVSGSHAAEITWPEWQKSRVALDRCLVREEFRIYYATGGPDAIDAAGQVDADLDGVPDKIQNIALQLIAARRMYAGVMGLRHPFQSPRYRGRVRYFDVHVRTLPNRGTAGDAIVNYHRPTDPSGGVEVLSIDIDKGIDTRNLTPAHELFHEFQNGYTMFKNAWYTEGMARWSEHAFRAGVGRAKPLPRTSGEVVELFGLDYAGDGFWNALAQAADPEGALVVPRPLLDMRYIGDAKPIVEDALLHGVEVIRLVLEEFDRADDIASREAKLDLLDWPEARQRSAENNRYLWDALTAVCVRFRIRLPDLLASGPPPARERLADAPPQ